MAIYTHGKQIMPLLQPFSRPLADAILTKKRIDAPNRKRHYSSIGNYPTMHTCQPIGIFDSGIGGLAVVRAIKALLPNEAICYVGDTLNLPYGEKSTTQLQSYTKTISTFLLRQNCKIILIACNTATAAAATVLQGHVSVPILHIIHPVITYVQTHYPAKTIGLIGTNYTIQSGIYTQQLNAVGISVKAVATPLLAPMIEQSFSHGSMDTKLIQAYLRQPQLSGIHALILGCTHYLLIQKQIAHFYQHKLEVMDAANLMAKSLKKFLIQHQLAHQGAQTIQDRYIVSQPTQSFTVATQRLLGNTIQAVALSSANA